MHFCPLLFKYIVLFLILRFKFLPKLSSSCRFSSSSAAISFFLAWISFSFSAILFFITFTLRSSWMTISYLSADPATCFNSPIGISSKSLKRSATITFSGTTTVNFPDFITATPRSRYNRSQPRPIFSR